MPFADALMELAEPRPVGDRIKVAIERAARAAGIPYARAFNIWYGRARRIDAHEAKQIEQALQERREEEARNDIHDLRTRLLMVESRIAAEAANGRGQMVREAGPQLRRPVRGDSAMAETKAKRAYAGRGR